MLIPPTINIRRERAFPGAPTRGELTVVRFGQPEILFRCFTLELPWANNQRRVSCMPIGVYTAKYLPTSKFPTLARRASWYKGKLWELTDVPGRSEIKFHHGTTVADTEGCVLVGLDLTKNGINRSVKALESLHLVLSPFESGPVTVNVFEMPSRK